MFPWNIARSAEALLSRWAIKRVCKFLLKKKLGNFIVGDIDLDQLDVQLGAGTIQLSDLALNVDYINTKLDATSVFVKEGSIGSLVVKVPWKVQNCQIEIKGLEFVLTSRSNSSSYEDCSICNANEANKEEDCVAEETNNSDHERAHGDKKSIPLDVHQGVKTIAKMVKWLLTNFNIKIQNLIVAFDSSIEKVGKISEQSRVLVLRMNEIEYGTHVSESDTTSESSSNEDSFLGMTSLTNFVKFSGAAVDVLQLEPSSSASSVSVLTGKAGGFSGSVKLSIPWKNGSLDMQRLEADVSIDPVVLKLQPSTITSLLYLWKFLRRFNADKKCTVPHVSKVYALSDSSSQYHSFTQGSSVALSGGRPLLSSFTSQEAPIDALLRGAHYIPNWVPLSGSSEHEGDEEPDYAASVDQFFECMDGMWSARSSLYHSGLLNWTCSVFNTISAASNLASGSVCIPETPQPCEMNIKASVGGIAIVLSVHNEGEGVHYLMANCKDLVLAFQICSEKTNFQVTLRHFRIDEYYEDKDKTDCQAPDCDGNSQDKDPPVQFLQTEVLSVMPQWDFSPGPDAEGMISGLPEVDVIRVSILEFSDDCSYPFNMSSSSMIGVRESSFCFTVKLAPFILWVISSPINVLVDLMKKVCNSPEVGNTSGILSSDLHQSWNLQHKENVIMGGTSKHVTAKSPIKNVQGSVSLSNARLIVCFPFQCGDRNLRSFIGLDFSHGLNDGGGLDLYPKSAISSLKDLSEPSIKVHLRFGDLNAYLITSSCRNSNNHAFSAKKFLFVSRNKKGQCSSIGISWQENPVSGPWATKKAKCRATSNDSKRTRTKVIGKDCEFVTARIATGTEEGNGCLLQEMIMASALSFHACFPLVQIELDSCEYRHLLYLLTEGVNDFMCGACDLGIVDNEGNIEDLVDSYHGGEPSQTTIILECDVLSIYATLECVEVGSCLQRELPGYWASLRLNVEKFELLSASNVGGSNGAKFLSISHGEGELWGSLDESVGANNFLLVSCSNSAMKRGDGEGTNALSSYSGGSTIINFWESLSLNNYTSVSIRCVTIIAPGGRLDWMNAVCSFFSLSSERESPVECSLQEICAEDSFSLSLVDSALSYEPKISVRNPEVFGSEHTHEEFVACIIAMSVLDVSKHAKGSSIANDYKLGLLDVGLLVSTLSGPTVRRDYGVDALRKNGYVKVAGEAIIDLVIRVNSSEEPLWELECSDFHVKLNTCQDTTAAIVHLASQLQQLFAPDMEESLAHLQTRWDMVQQAHGASENTANLSNLYVNCNPFPSGSSHDHALKKDDVVGLMDEIVQDAFQLSRDQTLRDSYNIPPCVKEELVIAASESNMRSDRLTDNYPIVPKFTESYCISRLLPLDSFPKDGYFSNDNSHFKFKRPVQGKTSSVKNSGWYEGCSWNIVENHVSNADNVDEIHEAYNIVSPISVSRAESCMPWVRVILKNFSICWKMYNGLDWNLPTSSRDSTYSMEWVLSSMNIQYDIFAEGEMYVSKLILSVREFHLYDRSRDAPWKMVLGYYHTKDRPRESYAESLKVELETVRPEPQIPLEEYRLCLSLLPLRLNLDQSQLDFLVKFFAFKSPSSDLLLDASNDSSKSIGLPTENTSCGEPNVVAEAILPFFQKCDINPVVVRVDYNPRHIDLAALRGGNYTELLNLVPWKGIELLLKDVHAVGLYGWGNVCETILGEWLEDISHNQIHKLLKGLAPIRSLVAVSTGAAKLVSLPVKSYRKDERLLKGIQRGAIAFVRSISLEAVGLGVHLAAGAHDILFQTECILTSGSSSVPRNINKRSVRSNQPRNARQGMLQAYDSLSDGLGKTASALVGNPLKTYQRGGGAGSALASAICAVPAAAIAPASAAACAMHCALLGVRNSLSPERKKESVEKYSGPSRS